MKYLLALILLVACVAYAQVDQRRRAMMKVPIAAGASCTIFQTNYVGGFTLNIDNDDQTYGGLAKWSNNAPVTICAISLKLTYVIGDITTNGYQGHVYEMSGDNLGTLRTSSTLVLGTNTWSTTEVKFSFPAPYATSADTWYALVVGVTNRNNNSFIRMDWDGTGNVVGTAENFWYNGTDGGANKTTPPWIKVWTQ